MAEAQPVAAPIEGVNATSTNTVEPTQKSLSPMEASFEDVIGKLNAKYAGEGEKFPSLGDITDKVEKEAKVTKPVQRSDPKSPPAAVPGVSNKPDGRSVQPSPDGEPEPTPQKEKYKVGDQEYELTPDQAKRFTQKGIHLEKRVIEIQKGERQIQEWQAHKAQEEQQKENFFKQLAEDPGAVLEKIYGPEIFEKMKPWAAQRVQKEMEYEANPQLAAIEQERQGRMAAEQQLQQFQQERHQQQVQQQASQFEKQFSDTIHQALEQDGIPKTDFTAAEMAGHMERALARKIDYTPQQLAQIVREDNTMRVRALTDGFVSQVVEARKNNDQASIIKAGEQVVEMFGEPLMYAMAKYHLAKLQRGQPAQPKQILETPRNLPEKRQGWGEKGRQYMTEDQYADTRRKIARGEIEPPPGW